MTQNANISIWKTPSSEWLVKIVTEEDTLSFYVTKDVVQALAQKEQAFYDIRGAFSGVTSGYSSQLSRHRCGQNYWSAYPG